MRLGECSNTPVRRNRTETVKLFALNKIYFYRGSFILFSKFVRNRRVSALNYFRLVVHKVIFHSTGGVGDGDGGFWNLEYFTNEFSKSAQNKLTISLILV